ncbi:MAG: hypothetical protein MUD01_28010 [Chloroflexaceae bacterium]|nr:hypothetical protein [Chloroflexaceae bacterium]
MAIFGALLHSGDQFVKGCGHNNATEMHSSFNRFQHADEVLQKEADKM